MDINMLNTYTTEIYLNGNGESFERLLVGIDNAINNAAHIIHKEVKDKILYSSEDIRQEILIKLWLRLIGQLIRFDSMKDATNFIFDIAKEVLKETRE